MLESLITTIYLFLASVATATLLAVSTFIPGYTQQGAVISSIEQSATLVVDEELIEEPAVLQEPQIESEHINLPAGVEITPEIIIESEIIVTSPIIEAPTPTPSFYETPPLPLEVVNTVSSPALVNILCASTPGSSVSGAIGSGIIIDPRGVILTNAHVAQYLLVKEHPNAIISCVIRSGSPAKTKYTAEILTFPYMWAQNHGKDLQLETPTGTGEHDWALLYITGTTDGTEKPLTFPFVSFDTREAVTTMNDPVLLASYPAGFLGSALLQRGLWPVSTTVEIQKVYTFSEALIDILSLGGTIVAQGGSSGGAVMNQWNKLVGIIVTSSVGNTTAERDLRALTLSHIDRSLQIHTGNTLLSFLNIGDFENRVQEFGETTVPNLLPYFPI
ncbi:trypsin-like peptidase domain-containing protein [Candidatus Kaiserbacteria bacterium]|nr:MAG: trypsin-like peptidase domain-containing protein [Candidatus Kaiserbacteria bacterium]